MTARSLPELIRAIVVVAQSPRADLCQARVSRCSEAGVLVVSSHNEVQIHSGADDADF